MAKLCDTTTTNEYCRTAGGTEIAVCICIHDIVQRAHRWREGEGARERGGERERERAHYTIKPPIDMTDALSPTHFDTFFEPPNLTFPVSMLSIRIASMLFTCCFEASILHSWPVCYLYVLPVCYLHAASKLRSEALVSWAEQTVYLNGNSNITDIQHEGIMAIYGS